MINIPNAVLIILPISAYFTQPLVPGDFDWYRRMKCQHVTDKNQFPDFTLPLLPTKLGQNSPDKKECVFRCAGGRGGGLWGNTSKRCDSSCQTESKHCCYFQPCAAFHFAKEFVNYLNSLSPSVCARLDSWSRLLCARNLLFSVSLIAMSPLQLCTSFSHSAPENETHPRISPLIPSAKMNTSGALNFNTSK